MNVAPATFSDRVTHWNHLGSLVDLAHSRSECRQGRLGRLRKAIDLSRMIAFGALFLSLTASVLAQSSVTLAWDAVTNASVAGYRVYQGLGSGSYASSTNAGTQTTTTLSSLAVGKTYYFAVTAYSSSGIESDFSTEVSYAVPSTITNAPPTILLSSPTSGATYSAPATVNLAATVTANSHTINKVQFYSGGTLLGESLASPYTFTWANVPAGSYSLSARAIYDSTNTASSSSSSVTVNGTVTNMPAGLVAAYGFEEGTGTTTADKSGAGNNGSLSGASWSASGRFGKALSFNGTGAAVIVNDAASLDLTTGMTLEAWIKPSDVSNWHEILYKGDELYYLEGSTPITAGPSVGIGSAGTYPMLSAPSPVPLNTWSHLAATYDGSTLRFFVNGVQVASRPQTGPISTSGMPLTIGADTLHGTYFAGLIDEVRVYNRALTSPEVQIDMNTPVSGATPGSPPTIALASPANGASYDAPANISVSASVVTNGHTINKVQFYSGATLLGETASAPFTWNWNGVGVGIYNISLRLVFDGSGTVASVTNQVKVLAPPAVTLTSPAAGSSFVAPANVPLAADVVANGHTITKVQFYSDATLLGESTSAPYSTTAIGLSAGSYSVYARAVYDSGSTADSAPAPISVANPPPSIAMTSPADGSSYAAPASLPLAADVVSNGHTITKVQFYSDSTLLGESTAAPYTFLATSLNAGSYVINARATYDTGSLIASSPVNVIVTNPPPVIQLSSPADGSTNVSPAPVIITASVIENGHSISSVQFYEGTNLLGEAGSSPYRVAWTNASPGTYTITARLIYDSLVTLDSTPANLTVLGLPLPWQTDDIGAISNGTAWAADGNFSLTGAGSFGSVSDGFRFVYQVLSGDGQITAQLTGFDGTNSDAVSGVMIRETLADDAPYAFIGVRGDGYLFRARRNSTGAAEAYATGDSTTLPIWVRVSRSGDSIIRSHSTDGQNWIIDDSRKFRVAESIYFGLVVNSGSPVDLSTATITNVDAIP